MLRYISKRLLVMMPVLFGVSFICFMVIQLAPGDFLDNFRLSGLTQKQLEAMARQFGLDKPFIVQYYDWLKQVVKGNFGLSWMYGKPVFEVIWKYVGFTLKFSIITVIFSWGTAVLFGIYTATHRNSFSSQLLAMFSYIGISMPEFFLSFLWLYFISNTGFFPFSGAVSSYYMHLGPWEQFIDRAWHLVGPVFVLSSIRVANVMRITRGQVIEQLQQDFVSFARAKGMPEYNVIYKHALRNAINPLITTFGFTLAGVLNGSIIVEIVFKLPGLGRFMWNAMTSQDLYLVMAGLLLSSLMLIGGNLIADICLAVSDPRIRYRFR